VLAVLAIAATLGAAQSPNRQIQPTLSLAPPYFAELSYWNTGGTTQITEDFLRLTADRQHQRGRVTAAVPANIGDAWEVDVKFRVTGQADQFFGDGLAFWYTEKPLQEGPVFGAKDYFKGMGLFFDTYDNRDRRHAHRHPYISAMVNDGTRSYQYDYNSFSSTEADLGCHAEFRYRFRTSRVNVVRITYKDRQLSVDISLVDGQWQPCFRRENVDLPSGYYFGMSASTGDLSDNHDVLGMDVFKLPGSGAAPETVSSGHAPQQEEDKPTEEEMESINTIVSDTQIVKVLKQQAETHAEKLSNMHKKIETEMQTLNSHIVSIITKLQAAENEMDRRVRALEDRMHRKVQGVVEHSESTSKAWIVPFLALSAVVVGVVAFAVRKYRHLMKTHLP